MLKASTTEQADPYKTACFSPCSGLGLWALIFLAAALWTRLWVLFQCQQAVVGQWYFMQGLKHMIGLFSDQDLGVQTWKFSIFGFFQDDSGGWVWRVEGRMVGRKTHKERTEKWWCYGFLHDCFIQFHSSPLCVLIMSIFTDEEPQVQRSEVTCPRSHHSWMQSWDANSVVRHSVLWQCLDIWT